MRRSYLVRRARSSSALQVRHRDLRLEFLPFTKRAALPPYSVASRGYATESVRKRICELSLPVVACTIEKTPEALQKRSRLLSGSSNVRCAGFFGL